ncbi:hypothetical protein C1143_08050 [Clostridium botulinum]|nr:hypothetical protein C1143_08050 [Clostridium botulinum]
MLEAIPYKKSQNLKVSWYICILWIVFITHNLISWFKSIVLYGAKLENVAVKILNKNIGNIKGFVKRTSEGIIVNIPPIIKLAKIIADALYTPKYIQLTFNI